MAAPKPSKGSWRWYGFVLLAAILIVGPLVDRFRSHPSTGGSAVLTILMYLVGTVTSLLFIWMLVMGMLGRGNPFGDRRNDDGSRRRRKP